MKGNNYMNNLQTLIIVIALLVFVGVILGIVLPLLKRKNVDVDGIIKTAQNTLATVNTTMDTLRPFLTEVKGVDTFDKVVSAAGVAVEQAEQLNMIGKLEADKRKEAARQYAVDALNLMKVDVTPEVDRLIDGAIEAKVLTLGRKPALEQSAAAL